MLTNVVANGLQVFLFKKIMKLVVHELLEITVFKVMAASNLHINKHLTYFLRSALSYRPLSRRRQPETSGAAASRISVCAPARQPKFLWAPPPPYFFRRTAALVK